MCANQDYSFGGQQIHRLYQINDQYVYHIKIGQKTYKYSKAQLSFLSINALKHFQHSKNSFLITCPEDPEFSSKFSLDDIMNCFDQIDSLFRQNIEIKITQQYILVYQFIGKVLQNPILMNLPSNVKSQFFHFNSIQLSYLSQEEKSFLNDFILKINGKKYQVNFSLFSCVSDKFLQLERKENELVCSVPNEEVSCFIEFLNVFEGFSFSYTKFPYTSLQFLIDYFELNHLRQFVSNQQQFPRDISESVEFLSENGCTLFDQQFHYSISLLVEKIEKMSFDDFDRLSFFELEKLFNNSRFKVQNENCLFKLIVKLVKSDNKRKSLLNLVCYPLVSSKLMIHFFDKFPFEQIDSDIFESFKERLICDIAKPNTKIPSYRWKEHPKFISRKEISELFKLLISFFGEEGNIIDQVKNLINQNLKNSQAVQELTLENNDLKKQIIINFN